MSHSAFVSSNRAWKQLHGRVAATAVLILLASGAASADGDAKRGAAVYQACAACHSLEPGLHLTGPSLAGLWGKKAASIAEFPRYSKALKAQDFFWDETTLDPWVADPNGFVKDNYMTLRGIKDRRARADLIAFLRLALAPGGAKAVVEQRLIPAEMARGQTPEPLADAGPHAQVTSVRHCRNSYFVLTADGVERPFWEQNLRLKVDSGSSGPKGGAPVLVPSGMQGDRASLVFSTPAQLSEFLKGKC